MTAPNIYPKSRNGSIDPVETPEQFLARVRSMSSAGYVPKGYILRPDWEFMAHHPKADGRANNRFVLSGEGRP